jgi:hypothetical protein
METCEAIGRKFSIVEDIFRISLGVLRQGFFSGTDEDVIDMSNRVMISAQALFDVTPPMEMYPPQGTTP